MNEVRDPRKKNQKAPPNTGESHSVGQTEEDHVTCEKENPYPRMTEPRLTNNSFDLTYNLKLDNQTIVIPGHKPNQNHTIDLNYYLPTEIAIAPYLQKKPQSTTPNQKPYTTYQETLVQAELQITTHNPYWMLSITTLSPNPPTRPEPMQLNTNQIYPLII